MEIYMKTKYHKKNNNNHPLPAPKYKNLEQTLSNDNKRFE